MSTNNLTNIAAMNNSQQSMPDENSLSLLLSETKNWESCALQKSCESCYNYSNVECHWCSADGACHARASPYGCVVGAPCSNSPMLSPTTSSHKPIPTKAPHEAKMNCKDYTNCTACALSSWGCHWCSFDDKCHAVGSIYGCAYGVNCYSNDRCQRDVPQYVYNTNSTFGVMNVPPLVGIGSLVIALSMLGCLTIGFFGARAVKGAYEDLVVNTASATAEVVMEQTLIMSRRHPSTVRNVQFSTNDFPRDNANMDNPIIESSKEVNNNNILSPSYQHSNDDDDDSSLSQSLLLHYRAHNNPATAASMLSRKTTIASSSNANSIFCMCGFCYILASILVVVSTYLFLRYFPQIPQYNVCSDELDWRSIVDGMTSAKIGASFQILFSIYNPNRFDVELNLGSGTFNHDGTYVGRFEIPPQTVVEQQAITDLLVTITLRPDKWEALALTTEYYKGTLTFAVDISMVISAPFLGGYSYQVQVDNYLVHLADANTGRNLCACPQWSDVKPH